MGTEIKIVLHFKALENGVLQLASFLRKSLFSGCVDLSYIK